MVVSFIHIILADALPAVTSVQAGRQCAILSTLCQTLCRASLHWALHRSPKMPDGMVRSQVANHWNFRLIFRLLFTLIIIDSIIMHTGKKTNSRNSFILYSLSLWPW